MRKTLFLNRLSATDHTIKPICLPPTKKAKAFPRFLVPDGTPCFFRNIRFSTWRTYTTKIELRFERFEKYRDGEYHFRYENYIIRVHRSRVIHREDQPGYNTKGTLDW